MRLRSPGVMPFSTRAPNPPTKSTPTSFAAASSSRQTTASSFGLKDEQTVPIGDTEMRLFTTGMPYLSPTMLQVSTRRFAYFEIFERIR